MTSRPRRRSRPPPPPRRASRIARRRARARPRRPPQRSPPARRRAAPPRSPARGPAAPTRPAPREAHRRPPPARREDRDEAQRRDRHERRPEGHHREDPLRRRPPLLVRFEDGGHAGPQRRVRHRGDVRGRVRDLQPAERRAAAGVAVREAAGVEELAPPVREAAAAGARVLNEVPMHGRVDERAPRRGAGPRPTARG